MSKRLTFLSLGLMAAVLLAGCTSLDCPLNNTVYATYNFYNSSTKASYSLVDTLTVKAAGTDSVLLNQATSVVTMALPVSYSAVEDTLLLHFKSTSGNSTTDTLYVSHTNIPHFENLDCGTAMFHEVTGLRWTKRTATTGYPAVIDSISVTKKLINYEGTENFKIYLRNAE